MANPYGNYGKKKTSKHTDTPMPIAQPELAAAFMPQVQPVQPEPRQPIKQTPPLPAWDADKNNYTVEIDTDADGLSLMAGRVTSVMVLLGGKQVQCGQAWHFRMEMIGDRSARRLAALCDVAFEREVWERACSQRPRCELSVFGVSVKGPV